jgi:hypothetical protein
MDPQEAMRQHLRKEVLAMFVDPDDLEVKAMIEHAVRSMQVYHVIVGIKLQP